ncbi:hypothetical protein QE422_003465 [Chryseobacterium sp. SORGH_AS 447]|nr:hypothetical protein [Chryseobacterium sp. SORGH_AS_0447]
MIMNTVNSEKRFSEHYVKKLLSFYFYNSKKNSIFAPTKNKVILVIR